MSGSLQSATNYMHTVVIRNTTGQLADDLHVNLIPGHPAIAQPHVPPFPAGMVILSPGGTTIDASGATVAPNADAGVVWQSKYASDTLDPENPGFWTNNGNNIGKITFWSSLAINADFLSLGGGSFAFGINNLSPDPIPYTDFSLYTGADPSFFTETDYLANANTGSLVLSSSSGVLSPGLNGLGSFLLEDGYSAFSLKIDGAEFGGGSAPVPEPAAVTLCAIAFLGAAAVKLARRA
jgi:hypothetical protein